VLEVLVQWSWLNTHHSVPTFAQDKRGSDSRWQYLGRRFYDRAQQRACQVVNCSARKRSSQHLVDCFSCGRTSWTMSTRRTRQNYARIPIPKSSAKDWIESSPEPSHQEVRCFNRVLAWKDWETTVTCPRLGPESNNTPNVWMLHSHNMNISK
jgi:hypothetical protein